MMSYEDSVRQMALADLPWDKLEEKNILITGATGLIGSCMIDILMARKHSYHVYAAGRNEQRAKVKFAKYTTEPTFHFVHYDVMTPLESDIDFHYIIHAASNASPNFFKNDPVGVMKSNISGTSNLIEYGITHSMERFLYVSSGEVYGEGCTGKWKEEDSGYVDSMTLRACYPTSKRAAETLCMAYLHQYDKDIVVGRPCHTYGPGFTENDNRAYVQFLKDALSSRNIILKSRGEQYRSWIYVADCACALFYILLLGHKGTAYNIANEESNITLFQFASKIAGKVGRKVEFQLASKTECINETRITKAVFDTTRLNELGWEPLYDLSKGLDITINTLRNKV